LGVAAALALLGNGCTARLGPFNYSRPDAGAPLALEDAGGTGGELGIVETATIFDAAGRPGDAALAPADAAAAPPDLAHADAAMAHDLARASIAIRVNVNGPAYNGIDYPGAWVADPPMGGVCNGMPGNVTDTINGTADGVLFQGESYGATLACAVGGGHLPPGTYYVNLYFAEIYWGPGCAGGGPGTGARVFDIVVEGQTMQKGFDIFSEGGCAASTTDSTTKPIVKKYTIQVLDGTLDISLPASADNGEICAIEVLSAP
jgi:hypothetical protein